MTRVRRSTYFMSAIAERCIGDRSARLDHDFCPPNTGRSPMKKYRNPSNVHLPVASYVHQIEIRGPERMLILSGQIGQKLDGSIPKDSLEQLAVAWDNLHRNLSAA